ncbi:MAG: AAA-like domain-containing protein [Ardenticatenaceae bacterium]
MLTEAVIGVVTEAVFAHLSDRVRGWLGRDPQRLAFEVALGRVCRRFGEDDEHKRWAASLFDEHFLQHGAAPVLARCLMRDGAKKGGKEAAAQLAAAWADQLGLLGAMREQRIAELTPAASDFLRWLDEALRDRSEFQPLFDSRARDVTAEATRLAAVATRETAQATKKMTEAIEALPEELAEKFVEKIAQLMAPQPAPPQIRVTIDDQIPALTPQPPLPRLGEGELIGASVAAAPALLPAPQQVSEDGQLVAGDEGMVPPLEAFDLEGFLARLDAPGGGVKLRDRLYVEREADGLLRRQLLKWGSTTTIHAPRQTGKSSLLMRGLRYAKKNEAKVVFFNFQSLGRELLSTPESFLRGLAGMICRQLGLDDTIVAQAWQVAGKAQQKLTYFLEDHVLPEFEVPIIVAMDHADSLLQTDFYSDFFGLVRSWHDRRAFNPEQWEKLNIVMVISTEPYLLINHINQSPFNVGLKLELADFSAAQVGQLNQQHGAPVAESDFADLMAWLGGQPYLTRQAFYTLLTKKWSWRDFARQAATDDGPFGAHLRRLYSKVSDNGELKKALKEIIRTSGCADDKSCFRLLRAGLIKSSGKGYTCRCELYRIYFERKLS